MRYGQMQSSTLARKVLQAGSGPERGEDHPGMRTRDAALSYLGATLVLAGLPWLLLPLATFLVEAVEHDLSEGAAMVLFFALWGASWVFSGTVAWVGLRTIGGWTPLQALGIGVAASVTGGLVCAQGRLSTFLAYRWALEMLGIGVGVGVSVGVRAALAHVDARPPRHHLVAAARQCLYTAIVLLLPMCALVSAAENAHLATIRNWLAADVWPFLLHVIAAGLVAGLVVGLGLRRLGKWPIPHSVALAATAGMGAAIVSSAGTGAALLALLEVPLVLGAWMGAVAADHAQAFADSRAVVTVQSDRFDSH